MDSREKSVSSCAKGRQFMTRSIALIPCLNEEHSIANVISQLRSVSPETEIIVIDNCSTDKTKSVAEMCGVFVISTPTRGKSRAIRAGISYLLSLRESFDAVFMVDGDGTYSLKNLPAAIRMVAIDGYDVVIGTRVPNVEQEKQYRRGHKLGNRFLTFIFRISFGVPISDTLSGFRVMSPRFIKSFVSFGQGFELEAELNAHIYNLDASFIEIDVEYSDRAEGSVSKLNTYSDGLKIFRMIVWLFKTERPKKAFLLAGTPFLIVSALMSTSLYLDISKGRTISPVSTACAGLSLLSFMTFYISGVLMQGIKQVRTLNTRREYLK